MTSETSPVLEFPAWLHGTTAAIRRRARAEGQRWARAYLETGAFPPPRRMRPVLPGEVLVMHSAGEFDMGTTRWWMDMFGGVFMGLDECTPEEEHQRMRDAFASFCLSTPWGAIHQAAAPSPPWSAERMAKRLASVLRFWDVLQGPRYAYRFPGIHYTLDSLMAYIYRPTLEAWCPGGPASVREHLALTVERMARATREDCLEAVFRVIPVLVEANKDLQHREVLSDPDFVRERLPALPPEKFEDFSSAYRFAVNGQLLYAWDRELGRH
jgi:hypothetical protein